jgi:peptidoglycan/LPS O-acetylase OafA/YrhL
MASQKIDVLTSLRFFAAALVVVGHSWPLLGPDPQSYNIIPSFHGVTFFFVLSGFILTYNYSKLGSSEDIKRYLTARFARLWPLHVATFLLAIALLPSVRAELFTPFGLSAAALNVSMMHALVPTLAYQFSYNAVSWSISSEWFFYICFIWLINLTGKPFSRLFWLGLAGPGVMLALSLAYDLPVYDTDHSKLSGSSTIYIHPFTRVFDFELGMIAAVYFLQRKPEERRASPSWATLLETGAVVLLLSTAALTYSTLSNLLPQTPPLLLFWLERSGAAPIFALAIFILARERGRISHLLSHWFWVRLGELSFALYLVHQIFLRWIVSNTHIHSYISGDTLHAAFFAASLMAAYLLWRLIEVPARAHLTRRRETTAVPANAITPGGVTAQ